MDGLTPEQLREYFESSSVQKEIREKHKQYCLVEYVTINKVSRGGDFFYERYISCNYKFGPLTPGIVVKADPYEYQLHRKSGSYVTIRSGAFNPGAVEVNSFHVIPKVLVKLENGEWTYTPISLREFEKLEW